MINAILSVSKEINQDRTTVSVLLKAVEELGELAQAVNKNQGYEEIVSEVADVLISTIDAGYNAAIECGEQGKYEADLMRALSLKLDKWVQVYGK